MVNKITNFYSREINGEELEEEALAKNKILISYLIEAGVNVNDIIKELIEVGPTKSGEINRDIIDSFYKDTLLKKDKLYYHKKLLLLPPPPSPYSTEEREWYREPRIIINEEDLLDYYYSKFKINKEWVDKKSDIGALKFMLDNFKKFDFIDSVDFFLHLVDYVEESKTIFDLRKEEIEFAELLSGDIKNSKMMDIKYVWRTK